MKSDWISQSYREDSHYSTHYHLSSAVAELFSFDQVCLRTTSFTVMGTHFSTPVLTPAMVRGLGGDAPLFSHSWKLGKGSFVDIKII